ncbi:MAG: porin [Chitinophagaceae bacterium]|nr:porin [Chitinophagaceae bacterium]
MKKYLLSIASIALLSNISSAQVSMPGFGKGLNFEGKDSSFSIRFGFRFQNLYEATWDLNNDKLSGINNFEDEIMIRRMRLKFDGYAFSPKLSYKLELGLSNRDISGGGSDFFSGSDNIMLDAYADWNFYKHMTIRFGQAKLPGNIERVISSANLQLVDRSLLNSRFNIDRDMGIQLMNQTKVGKQFILKQTLAISQGEGRDVTAGSFGGHDFTFRVDALPFGEFYKGKDDYVGSALHYYKKPKLMVGVTYDINQNAARTNGQLGNFIEDAAGNVYGKTLQTLFVDAAFKYQKFSFMGEYAHKRTTDNNPIVYDVANKKVGTFVTGSAINLQAGYLLNGKHSIRTGQMEVVGRYTTVDLQTGTDENQYTIGFNRFISGHQLKIQVDATYRDIIGKNDGIIFRTQLDVHF